MTRTCGGERRARVVREHVRLAAGTILAALGVVGSVVVLAACSESPSLPTASGPGSPPPTSAASAPSASSSTGAPDPNAPEVNAAGDIPDNQVFVPYTPPGATFAVSVPQGWAQSVEGAATLFTDKLNSVRVETRPRPAAPDVASAKAQEVPELQGSVPGFVLGDVRMVSRTAGPVVLLTFEATSAPNPVTGRSVTEAVERYELWRGGQEAVLSLSGPKGADNVDPWKMITNSFRWQQ